MRRNPEITLRKPEPLTTASSRVSEEDIRGWFAMIEEWLTKNELFDILDDPTRIYNGDETSFYLHPKTKEVIARTGSRNVYEVEQAPGKQNVTVMFSFSAAGIIVTPQIILPGKRMRKEVAESFPSEWAIGLSERGWMDVDNFRHYIRKVFHPFLVQQSIKFPVIFFVDGHSSHKAMEVADVCQELDIILVSLYPNTTHITQPADVAIFKPLKDAWRSVVQNWRSDHCGEMFTLTHFGRALSQAVERGIKTESIKNGFRTCGLYPFSADSVDYTKCIARKRVVSDVPSAPIQVAPESLNPICGGLELESQLTSTNTAHVDLLPLSPPCTSSYQSPTTTRETSSSRYVSIKLDKVVQAVDMIGAHTMRKIHGDVSQLSREERTIRFFYREFVHPFVRPQRAPEPVIEPVVIEKFYDTGCNDLDVIENIVVHNEESTLTIHEVSGHGKFY